MRIPPNLKYFLFFLLAIGLIALGVLYLPRIIPGIGKIMIGIILVVMALLSFFALFKPALTFLYARADGIFKVYLDQNLEGFHVFTYHLNSSGRYGGIRTRDIQHYYVIAETGRLFYNCIYTHRMQPVSGRSGWEGFSSFEESVLPSLMFDLSMTRFSTKSGTKLQLGQSIDPMSDNHFSFEIKGTIVNLQKFDTATNGGIQITCTDKTRQKPVWKRII
jgi:hypothetical protein